MSDAKKARTPAEVDAALDQLLSVVDTLTALPDQVKKLADLPDYIKKFTDQVDQLGMVPEYVNKLVEQMANLGPRVTTLEQKTANGEKPMGPSVTARLDQIEATLKGAEKIIGTGRMLEVVPPDHVLSPTRRGLADYEDARTKLLKQKPGEILTLKHLGKSIDVGYDDGRILLRQAKVLG
jgi:hypothetical protein